jgi:hypothetical protein
MHTLILSLTTTYLKLTLLVLVIQLVLLQHYNEKKKMRRMLWLLILTLLRYVSVTVLLLNIALFAVCIIHGVYCYLFTVSEVVLAQINVSLYWCTCIAHSTVLLTHYAHCIVAAAYIHMYYDTQAEGPYCCMCTTISWY